MNAKYEKEKERRYYYNLRDQLNVIVSYINESINSISSATNIKQGLSVDMQSVDNSGISKVRDELVNKRDTLNHTIIPSINQKIYNLTREINAIK